MSDSRDLKDALLDAGYELTPVFKTRIGYGCIGCGDPHAETVNGWCIQCAVKDAPKHWDGTSREESGGR